MTVREFMAGVSHATFIVIRVPVFKENGSLLRYESFRDAVVEWPNIKGIDPDVFDRKIEHWFLGSCGSGDPTIVFDTTKGE